MRERNNESSSHENATIITNFTKNHDDVERIHYFISLPVEGHILGILWILREGYILDEKLYSTCYGNRLNNIVLDKIKEAGKKDEFYSEFTPFLFEPYFKKYESWRNEGLKTTEKLLVNEQNSIMVSIDLKDYYYRAMVNFKVLKESLKRGRERIYKKNLKGNDLNLNEFLTNFVEKVMVHYTGFFERKWTKWLEPNFPMIPLGFAPSLIISNWYLQGFDQVTLEKLHPAFYGRYVDDILVVFPSHEKSEAYGQSHIKSMDITSIIEQYFTINEPEPKSSIFKKYDKDDEIGYRLHNQRLKNYPYKEKSPKWSEFYYKNLIIQENKFKVFLFSHKNSKAIIDNFKKEIYKNSSEFRFMPESDKLCADFEKDIYSLKYEDSINKLKDIKNFEISRFQLSKKLSQLIGDSLYQTNEKSIDDILDKILFAFDNRYLEFLIFWEKLFNFLYINNKDKTFKKVLLEIITDINNIEFDSEDNYSNHGFLLKDKDTINLIKESLFKFLYKTSIRVISIKYDNHVRNIALHKIFKENNIHDLKIDDDFDEPYYDENQTYNFIASSLFNNYLANYPLMNLSDILKTIVKSDSPQKIKFNIMDPTFDYFKNPFFEEDLSIEEINDENNYFFNKNYHFNGLCYPRYVQFHECVSHVLHYYISNNVNINNNELFKDFGYLIDAEKLYLLLNYGSENYNFNLRPFKDECNVKCGKDCIIHDNCENVSQHCSTSIINVNYSHSVDKIKIGVVNTLLDKKDPIRRFNINPNLSANRLDKIKKIINEAIDKKVELLVMPEMYIPYEWIGQIIEISRKNQIALIFGIEYIINNGKVGNYLATTLPTTNEYDHFNCILGLRLKNHYSPTELNNFRNHSLETINEKDVKPHYLFYIWKNIYMAPYCCFEIADIKDRSIFKSCCEIFTVSEFNKDTVYFNSIAESLSRDLYCFCIKSNTSKYGGTCILRPTQNESKYLVQLKGGENDYVVTSTLDLFKLREDHRKEYGTKHFKPKPPGFIHEIPIKKQEKNI